MLLQEDIRFLELYSVNDMLFATVPTDIGEDLVRHQAVKLAEDGSIQKVLGGGWHGHNAGSVCNVLQAPT